jgi:hypothetical protein
MRQRLRAAAYTQRVKSVTPALALMLAVAALLLGAAIAWATMPPARGGHAVTIVPSTTKATRGSLAGATTTRPTRGSRVGPTTTEPTPGSLVGQTTTSPFTTTPGGIATPSFTVAQTGNTVTLDASASPCHNGGCGFSWRIYGQGGNRLGSTMGFGPVLTYTLPAAGVYQVVLTKAEYCAPGGGASLRSCPRTAQQTITAA